MPKLFSGTTELNIKQHLESRKKKLKMKKNKWNRGVGREGSGKYFHFLVVLHCGTLYLELCRKLMFNYWKHNSSHSTAKQYLQYILSRHCLIDGNIEKLQHGWSACLHACVRWLVAQWNRQQQWQNARTLQKLGKRRQILKLYLTVCYSSSINWCLYLIRAGLIINFTLFVRMICRLCDCLKYTISFLSAHTFFFTIADVWVLHCFGSCSCSVFLFLSTRERGSLNLCWWCGAPVLHQ